MGLPETVSAWLRTLACAWVLAIAWPAPVSAQGTSAPTDAREQDVAKGLFQAGKAAYEAGHYADALKFFEQAYDHSHLPKMYYNIGQSADRLRQDDRALEAFRAFLEQVPNDPLCEEVRKRVAALERSVAERDAAQRAATTQPEPAHERVPQPSEVAATQAASADADVLANHDQSEPDSDSITSKWWFWTGVGVLVAGGATALVIVLQDDPDPAEPIRGEVGGVVQTLGRF